MDGRDVDKDGYPVTREARCTCCTHVEVVDGMDRVVIDYPDRDCPAPHEVSP